MSNYKDFVSLCESIVQEVSTGLASFKSPGAQEVLKYLHKNDNLGHDLSYNPIPRINWQILKDLSNSWFLLEGEAGFAAIKFYSSKNNNVGTYTIITSYGTPNVIDGKIVTTKKVNTATEGNAYLKQTIGKIKKAYSTRTQYADELKKSRYLNKPSGSTLTSSPEELLKRFSPIFKQSVVKAIADVKGVITNAVKNDAFDYANKKVNLVNRLQTVLSELDNEQTGDFLKSSINNSIVMTARYYYPKETGELKYGYGYSRSNLVPESKEGMDKVLLDIGKGDREKLSAVLAYFKRSLIS